MQTGVFGIEQSQDSRRENRELDGELSSPFLPVFYPYLPHCPLDPSMSPGSWCWHSEGWRFQRCTKGARARGSGVGSLEWGGGNPETWFCPCPDLNALLGGFASSLSVCPRQGLWTSCSLPQCLQFSLIRTGTSPVLIPSTSALPTNHSKNKTEPGGQKTKDPSGDSDYVLFCFLIIFC